MSVANEKLLLIFALAIFLGACSEKTDDLDYADRVEAPTVDFNYISAGDGRIRTLHDIKYEVEVNGGFDVTKSKNRVDQFNGTPYKISLAAFIADDTALMIHAETVADLSGASDYSNLPQAEWPNETFRSSGHACLELPAEEVEGEHDLQWLRNNGFEPTGTILFGQYFATTEDKNAEIVISIMQHVSACDDESANSEIIRKIQATTSVIKIE